MINSKTSQNGNVLFLILIAVVLFAALSFAVTRANQGTGKNTNEEEIKIDVARVVQDCGVLRQSTARFMANSDKSPDMVQVNDGTDPYYPCRTGANCLFAPEGGGAIIPIPPIRKGSKGATTPYQMYYEFYDISDNRPLHGYASNKPVLMFEAHSLSYEVCLAMNKAVGRPAEPEAEAVTTDASFREECVNATSEFYFRCPLNH